MLVVAVIHASDSSCVHGLDQSAPKPSYDAVSANAYSPNFETCAGVPRLYYYIILERASKRIFIKYTWV